MDRARGGLRDLVVNRRTPILRAHALPDLASLPPGDARDGLSSLTKTRKATGGAEDEGPGEGDSSEGGAGRGRALPRGRPLSLRGGSGDEVAARPATSWQWQLSSRPEALLDVDA
jgi:hypothetical protein